MTVIEDARSGVKVGVSDKNRMKTEATTVSAAGDRSRDGRTFGAGTGFLTTKTSMDMLSTSTNGSVFWLRNDATSELILIEKIIWGWNGGSTNFNKPIHSLIYYNTAEPTGNHTATTDGIENIDLTGQAGVSSGKTTIYKWDGAGDGMTVGSGGFSQIPNTISIGETVSRIDDVIILGPGKSIEFRIDSNYEAGIFHLALLYSFVDLNEN